MTKEVKIVSGSELKLRDKVRSFNGPYSTATVVRIEKPRPEDKFRGLVHLFRPFVHTADFEGTWGVTPYIGFEQYPIWMETKVELLEEG